MPLTRGQIEEAMGRAGLVYELLEVERRAVSIVDVIDDLRENKQAAEHGGEEYAEDVLVLTTTIDERQAEVDRLLERSKRIVEQLWGEGAEPGKKSWREEIAELDREQALFAIEHLLRRRPEVTPPEDVDGWSVEQMRNWLVEKIAELPEEERTGWSR